MPSDRRMFLGAGLGVTAALASRASGLTTAAQAVSSESPPRPGNISFEPELRAAAAHDFGRLIHGQPRGVLKPASSADIASLMRWAKGQGVKVAARGQGHSTYGRALVEGGIVVDMSAMNSIRDIKPDRVVVDAGITWKDLLDATLALGLTPPVLTNYLGLSIGGTIAVGGIGSASSRHGMQTDNVIALDVVTGEEDEVSCSATEHPDLFDGIRAGLGQCGIVARAPDDRAVLSGLSDQRSAAVIADLTYREDALAFGKFETLLRSKGHWSNPQPWLLTFLRGSNAERVAGDALAGLTGDAVGPFGRITFYPLLTKAFRTPLVRLPEEDIVFVFNLIRILASNDAAVTERMVSENRTLYDRIREAGGVQYPVGAFAMSSDDWTAHFGSRWPQLREAKRRHDPGHLLTPGYDVF